MFLNKNLLCIIINFFIAIAFSSCAALTGNQGSVSAYYYIQGLNAERDGDMVKAADAYQKALDEAVKRSRKDCYDCPIDYIPTHLFPDQLRRSRTVSSLPLNADMIAGDLQRVKSTNAFILGYAKDYTSKQEEKNILSNNSSQKDKLTLETNKVKISIAKPPETLQQKQFEPTKEVIVAGVSVTREGALKEAIRNAVEQSVGVYINSSTYVKNSQLISDEILSYSKGYINDYNIISEDKLEEGYRVKIFAKVDYRKVEEKLAALNIIKLSGKMIFADSLTELDKKQNAIKMIEAFFKKNPYPEMSYEIIVSSPRITTKIGDKVDIVIGYTIKLKKTFLKEFYELLKEVETKEGGRYIFFDEDEHEKDFAAFSTAISLYPEVIKFIEENLSLREVYIEFTLKSDKKEYARKTALSGILDNNWDRRDRRLAFVYIGSIRIGYGSDFTEGIAFNKKATKLSTFTFSDISLDETKDLKEISVKVTKAGRITSIIK